MLLLSAMLLTVALLRLAQWVMMALSGLVLPSEPISQLMAAVLVRAGHQVQIQAAEAGQAPRARALLARLARVVLRALVSAVVLAVLARAALTIQRQ